MERTEFGHKRTVCACQTCILNCKHMPGCLIPSDLARLIPPNTDPFKWAERNLRASPGALVANSRTGKSFRIPTLTIAAKPDGSCIHLTAEERCAIHDNAPFGCAFFDCSDASFHSDLSAAGLMEIMQAQRDRTIYYHIWVHLKYKGLEAIDPKEARRTMVEKLERK